jgi:ECF transporter S component (folate family)
MKKDNFIENIPVISLLVVLFIIIERLFLPQWQPYITIGVILVMALLINVINRSKITYIGNRQVINRITTGALLIGLAIIFEKLLVIQIPPFIRIGIGSIPVIMASVILGPLYGAIVGASADVIGYFAFDITGFPYTPFVTISFIMLGILPHYLFRLTKRIRYQRKPIPIVYGLIGMIWLFLSIYVWVNDEITTGGQLYQLDIYWKILLPLLSGLLFSVLMFVIYLINQRFQQKILTYPNCPSPYEISFAILVIEIIVHIFWGSFWKSIFFNIDFMIVWFTQALILIAAFPIKTFLVNYALMTYYRFVDKARTNKSEE